VQTRRKILQLLTNCPVVTKVINVQLDDVPVGILVIKSRLNERVRGPQYRNAEIIEPDVCPEQIVECLDVKAICCRRE
jgi:hypothetical protein